MRQRIAAVSGIGIVALLGLILSWGSIGTRSVSAMEKMAESVRRAKSCRCTTTRKTTFTFKLDDSTEAVKTTRESKEIFYWLAPDRSRSEMVDTGAAESAEPKLTKIDPGAGRPRIIISHAAESFHLQPANDEGAEEAFSPDQLANLAGRADRELGTQVIDGEEAWGFVFQAESTEPNQPKPTPMEIWIDRETNLPVLVRTEMNSDTVASVSETTDFQWNIDLDPQLFDATPPAGYTDFTWKVPTSGDPLQQIVKSLRSYGRMLQGKYPTMKQRIRAKDVEVVLRSIDQILTDPKRTENSKNEKFLATLREQREGLLHLWAIVGKNRDAAYYGETVGPDDKDKVLLRWKLDDGRYQVIFGDLRHEAVSAEQLADLEK